MSTLIRRRNVLKGVAAGSVAAALSSGCDAPPHEERQGEAFSPVSPFALTSISPDLGDINGSVPITLRGSGLTGAIGVTIGGTSCTNIVVVNDTTVTAVAPALAARLYDVQCTKGGGINSNILLGAYEAWHPTADYAAARVFQSDKGVTATTSATRHRAGRIVDPIVPDFVTRDGAQLVQFASGRLLLIGGWAGTGSTVWGAGANGAVTNEVLASDDNGYTWTPLLADERDPPSSGVGARFRPGHSQAVFMHTEAGVEYVYVIGDDANGFNVPNLRSGDVWRSSDGQTWSLISTAAPTGLPGVADSTAPHGRALYMWGELNGVIYIMGGQTNLSDTTTAMQDVYASTDHGRSWTRLPDAPWAPRCGPSTACLTYGGYLWVIGGAKYHSDQGTRVYYNDVWKFDGVAWTQVLATGAPSTPWSGRHYHDLCVYKSKMWIINGYDANVSPPRGGNNYDAYFSTDGATWTQAYADGDASRMPWEQTHAGAACALNDGSGILLTDGVSGDKCIWKLIEHTGSLVSAWVDQGSAALSVSQATDANKFIHDTSGAGPVPWIIGTGNQYMMLSAPDANIVGGVLEEWVIGKSLSPKHIDGVESPLVGAFNSNTAYNEFGINGDALRYYDFAAVGRPHAEEGKGLTDDRCRLVGVEHRNASLSLFVGTTQQGMTNTTVGFDTTYTGWETVGCDADSGLGTPQHCAKFLFGAVVILKTDAPSSPAFRTKLNKWAKKWGSISADDTGLALNGWWRANYGGTPWVGLASAGASSVHNLVTASSDPTLGIAQNGYFPANFAGGQYLKAAGTVSDYVGSPCAGWSFYCLVRANSLNAASGWYTTDPTLLGDNGGNWAITLTSSGVQLSQYDNGVPTLRQTGVASFGASGAYHLVQARFTGSAIEIRVDGGAWLSAPCTSFWSAMLPNTIWVGKSFAGTALAADVLDVALAAVVFDDATFDDIRSYVNGRYALSL